jgi:hypothetical protein
VEGSAIQRGGGGLLRYGLRMGDMLTGKRKKKLKEVVVLAVG